MSFETKADKHQSIKITDVKTFQYNHENNELIIEFTGIKIEEELKPKYIKPVDPRKVIDNFGDKKYYLDGRLNSWSYIDESGNLIELPAIERANGDKEYFINNKRHRDNGLPAIECANGNKYYYVDDKRHRDNGLPAIERANGDKEYYVNGKEYFPTKDQIKQAELDLKILELTRELEQLKSTKV